MIPMYNNSPIAMLQALRQPRGVPHHGGVHVGFEEYIFEVAHGRKPISDEFKSVVLAIVKEQADGVMAQHGYMSQEVEDYDKEAHRRFKEKVEKMRDMTPTEAARAIDEHFSNVTPHQRKVLQVLSQECSKRKMAEKAGMSVEDFMKCKHELEKQLK